MEQATVYKELCQTFAQLKDLRDTNKDISNSSARKYCYNYWVYVAEKMHTIECANLKPNSSCLDISTGSGLLPFILKNMGHTCDATDISCNDNDLDKDVNDNNTQQSAFVVMRQVHGVELLKNLSIQPLNYIDFKKKYDCIFSTRIVWTTGWGFSERDAYIKFIINNLLDYADKIVLSWNIDDNIPEVLQPYVNKSQFEYGTLTIHTEKIK